MQETVLINKSWLIFAVIFIGIVVFMAIIRRIETNRIMTKFDKDDFLLLSFAVNYFGRESEPGRLVRSSGALVLTKTELYYRARYRTNELTIEGTSIAEIDVTDVFKGKPLNQQAIAIYYINEFGNRDKAVFRIPHSVKWVNLINSRFIKK